MSTPNLKKLALKLGTEGPVKTLLTPKRIQILYNGVYILQTTAALYVWEHPYYPQFYVPKTELLARSKERNNFSLTEGEAFHSDAGTLIASQCKLAVGDESTDEVLAFSDELSGKAGELAGMVRIEFARMQQWFEEDTPIYVHPKDPFKRVDVLQSGREVVVRVAGREIARAAAAMHLYETGLPVRFYLPLTSVDAAVLRPSETRSRCPYKGEAQYYSVEVEGKLYEDLFWYYVNPTVESSRVQGLLCPYNERVEIELDGVKLEQPKTHFGPPKENRKPSAV